MRIAVCSIAYNEAENIVPCIQSWKGLVEKHLVLVSSQPWFGNPGEYDGTGEIAKKEGAKVISGHWKSEEEQRNFGLAYLYDYDYVLIIDPDEFYTKEDRLKILEKLKDPYDYINRTMKPLGIFTCGKMITYWKNTDYVFSPGDTHKPVIAADPKQVYFRDKRAPRELNNDTPLQRLEPIDCTLHHLSWVKSDGKVKEKIETYAHAREIPYNWYGEIWKKWESGSGMEIRPYGIEKSKAIYQPAPEEIKNLIKKNDANTA